MSKYLVSDNQVPATEASCLTLSKESHAVAKPSSEAFGDLIHPYIERVFTYVVRRVGSTSLAEDITSDTFHDALIHWRKCRSDEPYLWLLGIARRKVANAFRDRHRRKEIQLKDHLIDRRKGPDEIVQDQEHLLKLQELVMRLPEDQREALLLQYLEQLSQMEVALVMGKSVGSVNSLQQRARQNLQRWGYGYFTNELQGESL